MLLICFGFVFMDTHCKGHTHRGADLIAHSKVKATLFIHGVVYARKFGKLWPVVFEGVIQQTIIRAEMKEVTLILNTEQRLNIDRIIFYLNGFYLPQQQRKSTLMLTKCRLTEQ